MVLAPRPASPSITSSGRPSRFALCRMRGTVSIACSGSISPPDVGAKLLELARRHQHARFVRSDGVVERLHRAVQTRAQRVQYSVIFATREYSSLPSDWISSALCASRSCRQPCATTWSSAISVIGLAGKTRQRTPKSMSSWIVLQRGLEERFAGQEHDDELRRRLHLLPVALRAQLGHVLAHLPRVIAIRCARTAVVGASCASR